MQNYCKTIGALAAASALVAGNASAQDSQGGYTQPYQRTAVDNSTGNSGLEFEIHAGYSTDYIFRGRDFGSDLIETGIDVAYEWNGLGLSAGAWYASFDNTNGVDQDELDLYAEVSKDFGFVNAAIGYIWYNNSTDRGFANPNGFLDDRQEVYFSLGREFYGFDVSLTYFWDIEEDNDGYAELALGKGYELSPCLTLNTGVALGYQAEQGQLGHLTAKVSLDWAFTETATLSPYIAHSWELNDDNDTLYANSENELFGGVILAVSF